MVRSRRVSVVVLSVFLAVGAVTACSSDGPNRPAFAGDGTPMTPVPTGNTDGGLESGKDAGDSGRDAGDAGDAGACNDLTLTGMLVDRVGVVGEPPVSSGGIVIDGNYDLTSYVVYVGAGGVAGPTGLTARATIRVAAGRLDQILETGGSSPLTTVRSRSTYSASAATFVTAEQCPNLGGGMQRQFTATGVQLVLTDLVTKEALTFVKR